MAFDPCNKYLILISEDQRRILVDAMANPNFVPGSGDEDEADSLLGLLKGDGEGGLTPDRNESDDVVNDFT